MFVSAKYHRHLLILFAALLLLQAATSLGQDSRDRGDLGKSVAELKRNLRNPNPRIRWSAAVALGQLGEEAKEAVPSSATL